VATVLEIEGRADLNAAAADVADLGAASRDLATDIDRAGGAARTAGTDLSGLGDGSDALASKSSQATGALGALAGGLEAVGLEKYAAGLQAASIGTDVMSGAGDALNLVAETAAGRWIVTTAQTVAHTVATGAQTVATGAQTAAQGALNAVMAANPILLVVLAVAALVAGLVLAYKHSEQFRAIVDGAFSKAREVVEAAAGAVSDFIDWTRDLPDEAREAWEAVKDAIGDKIETATGFFTDLIDDAKRLPREAAAEVAGYFADFFAPIQTAIGWVEDLIEKVKSIDFPDFPDIPGLPRVFTGDELTPGGKFDRAEVVAVSLEVTPQDRDRATRDFIDGMREYFARRGQTLSITAEPAR
jgi:hypothetical protein